MRESDERNDLDADEGRSPLPAMVRDPAGVLLRGYRWGLVAFVALVVPSVLVARMIPLQYEASSFMILTAKSIPDQFVPSTIVQTGGQQFEEIRSRVFTRERLSRIAVEEAKEAGEEDGAVPEIISQLRDELEVTQKATKGSGPTGSESLAIHVGLTTGDPERAASLVNRVVTALIDEHIAFRSEESKVTLDFMKREFERADQALREHQRKLALFREQKRGSLPEEQTATLGRLERINSLRSTIALELADMRTHLMAGGGDSFGPADSGDPRSRLEEDLSRLRVLYTDEHPQVQSIRRQLEALDAEEASGGEQNRARQESAAQRRARLEGDIAARSARLSDIDAEVARLEANLALTSEITEEFRALEREEVILQEAYSEYLRKLKSAELSRSMETSQKGIQLERVEPAIAPTSPVLPRFLFIAAAVVGALVLSLLFVVLHELLHPVVIDSAHLEALVSAPVLGSLPPVR